MRIFGGAEPFQFDDAGFVADPPWDDLSGMFTVVGFDDRPPAMGAVMTYPFEMMEIPCGMDLLDDRVAVVGIMW